MRILFVHTNFPGQFGALAAALAADGHDVQVLRYDLPRPLPAPTQANLFTVRFEADTLRAQSALAAAQKLAAAGFAPDVIIGHPAFGEMMLLDLAWPRARQIIYAENFISAANLTAAFDPEFGPVTEVERIYAQTQLAAMTLTMTRADTLVTPTHFQRATFPPLLADKITVVPDGVDTHEVRPRIDAALTLADKNLTLRPGDEVITYVNRNLEPVRGIHIFLRALALTLAQRPHAHVVIVGGPHMQAYGRPPPTGKTWMEIFFEEVRDRLDLSRVHFLGRIDRAAYLDVLAVSRAHVYLTYPFVPSWSLLESMSAGCQIIGSDTAPVREFITHGRNGVLVDFFDHAALADAISAALAHPSDALRIQARVDAIARFDFQSVAFPAWLKVIGAG